MARLSTYEMIEMPGYIKVPSRKEMRREILRLLATSGSQDMSDVGCKLLYDPADVKSILEELESESLVERVLEKSNSLPYIEELIPWRFKQPKKTFWQKFFGQ